MLSTIISWVMVNPMTVTAVAGWIASELLTILPVKANGIVHALAMFLVSIGNAVLKKVDAASAAVTPVSAAVKQQQADDLRG